MEIKTTLDGHDLRAMFIAGTDWLEKIVPDINALNVYPVPDGDCGTNMLFTLRESLARSAGFADGNAGAVAQAIAHGALMGARGNSGVILSQMWRGVAQKLKDKKVITVMDLAQSLQEASRTAYLSLLDPVEGTILTVMRFAAEAARREASASGASPVSVMSAAVSAARASVMNTPDLLEVLKDAGVVDAGGHGLYTFLEGALLYLKNDTEGRSPEVLSSRRVPLVKQLTPTSSEIDPYGFCTQFMIKGAGLNVVNLRRELEPLGKSLIVVGDASDLRVHIHTRNPEAVTGLASRYGVLFDIDIRDMDEQHHDFLLMNRGKTPGLSIAVVAIVNGDGMVNVFADLGVAAIVSGGQSMNPSTNDILCTIEEVVSDNIILLPNNKNIIPTAVLVQSLTKKNLTVIPSETIPQGISALVAFVPEANFDNNITRMTEAIATVRTIEITRATYTTKLNDMDIKEGQFIGLLDNVLLAVNNISDDVIFQLLERVDLTQAHIMTLYFGENISENEAKGLVAKICEIYSDLEVGMMKSGLSDYHYIISVE